jgi:ketosteroid isomerase-like protein
LVRNVEAQWVTAILKRDATALQNILRDDYTEIAPDGKTYNKAWEIASIQSPDLNVQSLSLQGLNVRVYQGGAVVTGTAVVKGTSKDTDFSGEYRFTDVFEPRNNNWQAVSRQLTKVEDEAAAKESKGKEKKEKKAKE